MKKYYQIFGLEIDSPLDEVRFEYEKLSKELKSNKILDKERFNKEFNEIQDAFEKILEYNLNQSEVEEKNIESNEKNTNLFHLNKQNIILITVCFLLILFPIISYLVFQNKLENTKDYITKLKYLSRDKNEKSFIIYRNKFNKFTELNSNNLFDKSLIGDVIFLNQILMINL